MWGNVSVDDFPTKTLISAACLSLGAIILWNRTRKAVKYCVPSSSNKESSGQKVGVLLINLGTPDSTKVSDVRKYLREFLMDERVIDIPFLSRWLLVNMVIAPFRAYGSSRLYKHLWKDRGSPLKYHSEDVRDLLQKSLGPKFEVALAMRYQSPSIRAGLEQLRHLRHIVVVPLFPQYASATTGSVQQKVMEEVSKWETIPNIDFVSNFMNEPNFVAAWREISRRYLRQQSWDFYVFSFHGLPVRHIKKSECGDYCRLSDVCCGELNETNRFCYRAQCFETARLIADAAGIPKEKYIVSFQSRLGNDAWVQPYTVDVIEQLPKRGCKKVLAFSPSFVSDCLETTVEVGIEFQNVFIKAGGERWQLVDSLNTHPLWVQCLKDIVVRRSGLEVELCQIDA